MGMRKAQPGTNRGAADDVSRQNDKEPECKREAEDARIRRARAEEDDLVDPSDPDA